MKLKFKAYDTINERWINLWKINISKEGEIMSVEDLNGEIYGLHQVDLYTDIK